MIGVDNNTETFVSGHANVEADEEEGEDEEAPPSRYMAETEKDAEYDGHYDMSYAGVADEEYSRFVTIADRPADEVGVRLTS